MQKAKFSPSTKGLYPLAVYEEFPADAIDVPDSVYKKYLAGEISKLDVKDGKVVAHTPSQSDIRQNITVTAFQAHAAIARSGLYDAVANLMQAPETPLEVKLAWEKAEEFRRLSPVVLEMAAKLNISEQQLDELFAIAATIEA
jgi:hypothetical protein